jgi:hypothetical protein
VLEADHFSMPDSLDISYTPKAILIIRDLFGGKMRFRSLAFERDKS